MEDAKEDYKYVWLNPINGTFSNSWTQEFNDKFISDEEIKEANIEGWKLIKYKCVNDSDFEFMNMMKLR